MSQNRPSGGHSAPIHQYPLRIFQYKKAGTGVSLGLVSGIPLWKRILDLTCIVISAPIIIPLSLVVALIIKLASPGPVIFKQERIGYLGRRFRCLKFRTMRISPDPQIHHRHLSKLIRSSRPLTKLDEVGDPRLIPCGLLLRSLGLDELPQVFNILCGEMSLVGPRPCLPYEYEQFSPDQRRRSETLPGLTGFWQVSGKNRTTFEEMIALDLYYLERRSLPFDLRILARTMPAILRQLRDLKRSKKLNPGANPLASHQTERQTN